MEKRQPIVATIEAINSTHLVLSDVKINHEYIDKALCNNKRFKNPTVGDIIVFNARTYHKCQNFIKFSSIRSISTIKE